MTARKRIESHIDWLQRQCEIEYEEGTKLLDCASEGFVIMDKIQQLLPQMTDQECEQVVKKWDEEKKPGRLANWAQARRDKKKN